MLLKCRHPLACRAFHQICNRRLILHIPHHPLRHTDKPVARINRTVRPNRKSRTHTVRIRTDRTRARKHTAAEIVDIHNLKVRMRNRIIQKPDQKLSVLLRRQCPCIRVISFQRRKSRMELHNPSLTLEELHNILFSQNRRVRKRTDKPHQKPVLYCDAVPFHASGIVLIPSLIIRQILRAVDG